MWDIYDDLIAAVPEDSTISACLAGLHWFAIRSQGTGLAMTPLENGGGLPSAGRIAGMKTRDVARWIKSWNWQEAAMGLAAINSVLNLPATVPEESGAERERLDVFTYLLDELKGKKVAVVGHFRNLERLSEVCELSILERRPCPGDLPDPACEYILPKQDVVIMTATTLINKTMPRLLKLSRNARVVIAGPSTPLTPVLFNYGVDLMGGLVVEDDDLVWKVIQEGGKHEIFMQGSRMVKLSATELCGADRG